MIQNGMTYGREESFAMSDFGLFGGRSWLNAAHQGPLPNVAIEAARKAIEQKASPNLISDDSFFSVPRRLREALANLIGASPEDIILGNSATYGLDLLANGIRWSAGDEVLLVDGDFPADIFPWLVLKARGVSVRFIKPASGVVTAEELRGKMSPRTRLFCTSWVNSFNGHAIDLQAVSNVCRHTGVYFVLNASQGLGAKCLNMTDFSMSALTCCGYKWLCGPYGTGFCWIAPDLRESLQVNHGYWLAMQEGRSLANMRDYSLRSDLHARSFDVFCTANFLNFMPWTASIEYILQKGTHRIQEYDNAMISYLIAELRHVNFQLVSPKDGESRSSIVVVTADEQQVNRAAAALAESGVDIAIREGNLRLSPHFYNSRSDIDRAIDTLSKVR